MPWKRSFVLPFLQANLELKPSWTLFTPISADRWAFAQKEEPQHLMVLVDDRSRYTWAYFLKINPEALGCTKDWMIKVVRFTERKVKFDRSGNGEYTSKESEDHLRTLGVEHQTTVPFSSQENGVAERANRTIIERIIPCCTPNDFQPHSGQR
jgi:hypothetical protein